MAERKQAEEEERQQQEMIEKWKKQFANDRSAKKPIDESINSNEQYYQGKKEFGNLKDTGYNQSREVRTVINFIRTTIEALIDLSVPKPDLSAVALDDEQVVKLTSKYVESVCNASDLEEINLRNERRAKKFGGSFYKGHWNNAIQYGSYVGNIEISDPHPLHIIPNAGALDWDKDLEHYHHILNKTEKYILRRWPHITRDDLEEKAVLYKEYDEISDSTGMVSNSSTENTNSSDSGLSRWSIVETTYRDEDGDICKLWWSNDLILEEIPKFYWHRDENHEPVDTEILEVGTMIRSGMDEKGEPRFRPIEEVNREPKNEIYDDAGILIGIKVDYYIPKGWDIVYQVYLPKDLSCWGTSMIDDIKDLYESALKAVYIQEESFLRGRKKILCENGEDVKEISDPGSSVILVRGNVKEVDIGTNIDGIQWIEFLWSMMQMITGATNSVMGIHDPGVKSAKQAQVYVQQATYKTNLASAYKSIAFRKLYRMVADFAMAFCDDDRPFRISGDNNQSEYGVFSRLALLRDDNGNMVYPNLDINVSAQAGFMQNKSEVMANIVQLASQKAFEPTRGNIAYLKLLQKIGMPYLERILADLEKEVEKLEAMRDEQMEMQKQQQQQQLQGSGGEGEASLVDKMPPELQEKFAGLPPEMQEKMLAMVSGQ